MAITYTLIVPRTVTVAELTKRLGAVTDEVTVTLTRRDDTRATFRVANGRSDEAAVTIAALLERVLTTGDEDLEFLHLGEHVLLERRNGRVQRFPSAFWETATRP